MFKIFCGTKPLHDISDTSYPALELTNEQRANLLVWNISLTNKVNEPDSLTFIIHDTHPFSNLIYPNCEEIRVEKWEGDSHENIFYGRVLSTSININGERTITCESELGYLFDSIISPFSMSNTLNSEAVDYILKEHRTQVQSGGIDKRVYLGNISAMDFPYQAQYDVNRDGFVFSQDGGIILEDAAKLGATGWHFNPNFESASAARRYSLGSYINEGSARTVDEKFVWSTDGTERALDIIKRLLTDRFGGILSIRHADGKRYLDYDNINKGYQPGYGPTSYVNLSNLIDITYDKSAEERFTAVYPLGAEITETESLDVRALNGKTWLAFGDGATVCKPSNIPVTGSNVTIPLEIDISDNGAFADSEFAKLRNGKIAKIADTNQSVQNDSYTGWLSSGGTRYQYNKHTSNGKSYVDLLTEGAQMKTITMAEESETIFKHGGHFETGVGIVQDWSSNGALSTNRDKSVVERLYDMFGPAYIQTTTEEMKIKGTDGHIRKVTTDVAVKMKLAYDDTHPVSYDRSLKRLNVTGLRKVDFVTVAVGLNDWLNADSILGTNEMGRTFSAHLDVAKYTANKLHKWTAMNAIDDYFDKYQVDPETGDIQLDEHNNPVWDPKYNIYHDEDGKRVKFRKTMYWQIRYLCMYLKACFPDSHIIIFSSFGRRKEAATVDESKKTNANDYEKQPEGTDEQNKVGRKGWYYNSATSRKKVDFYTEILKDPYMKDETETNTSGSGVIVEPGQSGTGTGTTSGSGSQTTTLNGDWNRLSSEPPADATGRKPYDVVYFDDGSGGHWYEKAHIDGRYTKTTKSSFEITEAGRDPNRLNPNPDEDDYRAFAKVSRKETVSNASSGSGGSSSSGSGNESVPSPGEESSGSTGSGSSSESSSSSSDSSTSEQSVPRLAYLYKWNTLDGKGMRGKIDSTDYTSSDIPQIENAPEIICNPYDILTENSYSISDLNNAINEVCDELGIVYVDVESSAGISVNNYTRIKISDPDPEVETDVDVYKVGHTTTIPYDNISLYDNSTEEDTTGTRTGDWGESFIDGIYLNDRGQKLMACAVRNAMLECLVSDGTIDSVERLALNGDEKPYYEPILYDIASGQSLPSNTWRAMKIVPDGRLVKIDGVYDHIGTNSSNWMDRINQHYEDKEGRGKYDLIDIFGNYNYLAFEDLDMSRLQRNADATAELVPIAPSDPIISVTQFDDAKKQQDLFYAAAQYLYSNYCQNVVNITVKAVDMHIVNLIEGGDSVAPLTVGNVALITAPNYGLNNTPFVVDTIVESDDPSDTVITFKSVGAKKIAGEQLAANPYGTHPQRVLFSKLSELFNQFNNPWG